MNHDKVVVISGGSRGLGRALAELMAGRGYRVFGTTRRLASVESLPRIDGLEYIEMDVCDDTSVKSALAQVESEQGRIDILVNNAGISGSGPVEETGLDVVREQFETNYFGTLRCVKAVLPGMRARGQGTIVNVGSVGGVIALPFQSHYCATKFAIEGLTESLRHEVSPFGIRVILIEPTDVMTTIWKDGPHAGIEDSAYRDALTRFHNVKKTEMEKNAETPDKVAEQMLSAIESSGKRLHFGVGKNAELLKLARRLLPESLMLYAVRKNYDQ